MKAPGALTQSDETVSVVFQPEGRTVRVPARSSILSAAREADIYVNSVCGGDGACGKCKVKVLAGRVKTAHTELLSDEERQKGYVLACQTALLSDAEVEVPEAAHLDTAAILSDEEEFQAVPDPLVRKLCLRLDPPSLESNLAAYERVLAAVRRRLDQQLLGPDLCVLQQIPHAARQGNWTVTATVAKWGSVSQFIAIEPGDTTSRAYGIAVDVGTTTVVVRLVDLAAGRAVDAEAKYNSQIQYGDDYIHRIIYVEQNNALQEMQRLVVRDINELVGVLCKRNGLSPEMVVSAACAGNTVMLHFLLALDPSGLRREPYVPVVSVLPPVRASDIGLDISPCGTVYLLPCVGAYVGADITAGVFAVRIHESAEKVLFVDIGTNGEVVWGNREWMVCCSASAGPAFEGAGMKCGMRATRGAVQEVAITPDGDVSYATIGNAAPLGICGSGLIEAVAQMFLAGAIDRTGAFQPSFPGGRVRRTDGEMEFVIAPRAESATGEDVVITQLDVESLLRSKAAIYAAVSVLLESVQMSPSDIHTLYLAGGFGNALDLESAVTLGMIPDIPLDRVRFVGNTSIKGAEQALLRASAFEATESVANMMTYFDLIAYPGYMDEFVSALFIPHTDVEKFPSVSRAVSRPAARPECEVACASG